jgi:hypothetical protein
MICCPCSPLQTIVPGPQGARGATGIAGVTGPVGPAGPPGLNWRGPWNFTASYATNDAVSYGTGDWIALYPNTNIIPTIGSVYWSLILNGTTGPSGASGVEDVFTGYGNATSSSYTFTATPSLLNLSPTPPSVVLTTAGTYLLFARLRIDVSSYLMTGITTITLYLYDSIAAAAVPHTTRVAKYNNSPVAPTLAATAFDMTLPIVAYAYAGGSGTISMYGSVDTTSNNHTICVDADVTAVQINP